jgi:hypothetical protein
VRIILRDNSHNQGTSIRSGETYGFAIRPTECGMVTDLAPGTSDLEPADSFVGRSIFKKYDGKRDYASCTEHLLLHFQCDAELGGNLDNDYRRHS